MTVVFLSRLSGSRSQPLMLHFPHKLPSISAAPTVPDSRSTYVFQTITNRFINVAKTKPEVSVAERKINIANFLGITGVAVAAAYLLPGFAEGFVRSFNRASTPTTPLGKWFAQHHQETRSADDPMGEWEYIPPP